MGNKEHESNKEFTNDEGKDSQLECPCHYISEWYKCQWCRASCLCQPHAVALFCFPTRKDIDYKEFNKTKKETIEWEEGKTSKNKVIEYDPKTLPEDDDDNNDKDDTKSKKKESLSINPRGAIRELQRIGEIVTKLKTEPVSSDLISPLEHSILDLGKELGLN